MSKTLDFLAGKGIDCLRIEGSKNKIEGEAYYAINTVDDENFIDVIKECDGRIVLRDGMEIKNDYMTGLEIKDLNSKLVNLDDSKSYDILRISYPVRVPAMALISDDFMNRAFPPSASLL